MEPFKVIAPTRVDLAGGTLDLWPLYTLVGRAKTINMALGIVAEVSFEVESSGEFECEVHGQSGESFRFKQLPDPQKVRQLGPSLQFPVAVVTTYLRQKQSELPPRLFRIRIRTEAPIGSGLGGSSTLCVAILRGLSRLFNAYVDQGWQWEILEWVRDMEASYLRTPTGTQDYLAALFGGLNCFEYGIGGIEREPYPQDVFEALAPRLLVLFSGEMHQSGMSNWEVYRKAMEGDERVTKGIQEIAQVAEDLDGELRAGNLNWKYIGGCLEEEWRLRKTLFQVETPRLEEILKFLSTKSIHGAKVCGAAAGGSLVALVEPDQKNLLADACRAEGIQVLPAEGNLKGVTIVTSD